jgi:hypothetical protein
VQSIPTDLVEMDLTEAELVKVGVEMLKITEMALKQACHMYYWS